MMSKQEESAYCIVIAEDETNTAKALEFILKNEGYDVHSFGDGAGALQYIQQAQETPKPCHILITDVEMPVMSGRELLQKIAEQQIALASLVITGYGEKKLMQELIHIGCDDFLDKPFTRDDVLQSVAHVRKKMESRAQKNQSLMQSVQQKMDKDLQGYKQKLTLVQKEVNAAKHAHKSLIKPPQSSLMPFYALLQPLNALGGDYIELREEGRICSLLMADVSGHDMGASYHTVLLKSAFSHLDPTSFDPHEVLEIVDQVLVNSTDNQRMVCALALQLNLDRMEARVASAGMPPVCYMSAWSRVDTFPAEPGPALGLGEKSQILTYSFALQPGARMAVITDGLLESSRMDGPSGITTRFGMNGVKDTLQISRQMDVKGAAELIMRESLQHCRYKQKDDISLAIFDIPPIK
jgi:phosphoserine phosphatase RsbU/P